MLFEIDDIKRRHSGYFDTYSSHGWVDAPEGTWGLRYAKSVAAALPALVFSETIHLWRTNFKLLKTYYQPPKNFAEFGIFHKEIMKMDNFKKAIGNRMQYALLIGFLDLGPRMMVYRALTEGVRKTDNGYPDFEFWRNILPTIVSAALTCWLSIPYENARALYYADRTYPKELQNGYKSIFNTLRRVTVEDPYQLFKGSTPIMARNYVQFSVLCYLYDFLFTTAECFGPRSTSGTDAPTFILKWLSILAASAGACFFSVPFDVYARQLVDFYPKIDGKSIYKNNYRRAIVATLYTNHLGQIFQGLHTYMMRQGPWMVTFLYLADSFGLFKRWDVTTMTMRGSNNWENNFQ